MSLKMKGAVLDQLVYRLRSGRYKQGSASLRARESVLSTNDEDDLYCCLGVLCEMAVEAGVITRGAPVRAVLGGARRYGYGEDEDQSYLPIKVVEWAGIHSDFEKYEPDTYYYERRGAYSEESNGSLAVMNDKGVPFPDIADWMVQNVERI